MDPNQQPQSAPQPTPPAPATPPYPGEVPPEAQAPTPQPASETFGAPAPVVTPAPEQAPTPAQSPFTESVNPVQPAQSYDQPQADPHFPADHPLPDGTVKSEDPGKTMGIVAFVLLFVGLGLVSVILGIIARKKSKQAGRKNGFALAAIIVGVLQIIAAAITIAVLVAFASTLVSTCNELGSGTHVLTSGQEITCNI